MNKPCPPCVKVREFRPADAQATRAIFHDAVLAGTSAHYTRSQRVAWAGGRIAPPGWVTRLRRQHTLVATQDGRVLGFMSMATNEDNSGYIDLAFVMPTLMGSGIATRIYAALEDWALKVGLTRFTTEASHLARPFFIRQGWTVEAMQTVDIRGQLLENFRMVKQF